MREYKLHLIKTIIISIYTAFNNNIKYGEIISITFHPLAIRLLFFRKSTRLTASYKRLQKNCVFLINIVVAWFAAGTHYHHIFHISHYEISVIVSGFNYKITTNHKNKII